MTKMTCFMEVLIAGMKKIFSASPVLSLILGYTGHVCHFVMLSDSTIAIT